MITDDQTGRRREAGAVNRADFQQSADLRTDEAKTLLDQGKWPGAYYLAGYAVECGLKACIAELTNQHDFPPEKKFVQDCYTHNLETWLRLSGHEARLRADATADADLRDNWNVVKDWDEQSRYELKAEAEARALYEAITEAGHGVLPWIKARW